MIWVRSVTYSAALYSCSILLGLLTAPLLLLNERAARGISKIWARAALWGAKHIAGVSYRVEGAEHIPTEGAIIAANHQSMWETIALFHIAPRPVIIYKKELSYIPIYGWALRGAGHIAVDRAGGARALRAMRKAAAARLAEGCQIIVFPEGTRLAPGETAPFHPGIAGIYLAANAPCVPAAHDSGRFWRFPGLRKIPGKITLRFLPPIAPGLDRKVFLCRLKDVIDAARPDRKAVSSPEKGAPHGN